MWIYTVVVVAALAWAIGGIALLRAGAAR